MKLKNEQRIYVLKTSYNTHYFLTVRELAYAYRQAARMGLEPRADENDLNLWRLEWNEPNETIKRNVEKIGSWARNMNEPAWNYFNEKIKRFAPQLEGYYN